MPATDELEELMKRDIMQVLLRRSLGDERPFKEVLLEVIDCRQAVARADAWTSGPSN